MHLARREFVKAIAATSLFSAGGESQTALSPHRLKIVVAGAHPGDPECGCGGTIARYTALGHDVVLLYLNRGEGFCGVSEPAKCAAIRTEEAQQACRLLGARAAFAGQIDGQSVIDDAHYQEFRRILQAEKPDILFAQWPIDNHRDHRALSALALDSWLAEGRTAAFFFYEVAEDTMMFTPAEYVDISASEVESKRRVACFAHASQQPQKWYPKQVELTARRGADSGCRQAEAFVRHSQSRRGFLP